MPHREWHGTDITCLIVESPSFLARGEHRHAASSTQVILPLVGIWVPVHLPHAARLYLDKSGRNRRGCWEVRGVYDANLTTGDLQRLLFRELVGVFHWSAPSWRFDCVVRHGAGHLSLEYPARVLDVLGMSAKAASATPKFFATISRGVCANQSVSRHVSFSEKFPSSNASRNSQPSSRP